MRRNASAIGHERIPLGCGEEEEKILDDAGLISLDYIYTHRRYTEKIVYVFMYRVYRCGLFFLRSNKHPGKVLTSRLKFVRMRGAPF